MAVQIPTSEAEVFERYFPHVKFLVARSGIRKDNVEDYAMALMLKFVEKDVLSDYDPERLSEFEGKPRTANFKTFLSGFVSSYLRHFHERDIINAQRSAISTDVPMGENQDIPFLDYLGYSVPDDTEQVEVAELLRNVRSDLSQAKGKSHVLLFDMILLQVTEHGKIDVPELAELFGVSRATVHNWLRKVRESFDRCM